MGDLYFSFIGAKFVEKERIFYRKRKIGWYNRIIAYFISFHYNHKKSNVVEVIVLGSRKRIGLVKEYSILPFREM